MTDKPQFDGKKVKVKLADVCTLTMGQSPSSNSYNEIGNGIPFFQGNADFGEEAPVPRVWCTDPKKTAEGGDLLISVRAPIGAVNMAVERCCIGRGVAAIHPNDDSISVDFLKHQLLSKRRELETMGTGSTFKAVGKKSLGNLTLVLYPEDTQHEIERCLNQIKKQIKAISSQSSKLDSLVKSRFIEMFGYKCTLQTDTEVMAYIADYLLRRQGLTLEETASVMAAPFWSTIERMKPQEAERLTYLRKVFPSLLLTGPFSIILGFSGGLMALNDRLKLRSMVVGEKDDRVFISSEEAAIRVMEPDAENIWAPMGGEPVIVRLKEGTY